MNTAVCYKWTGPSLLSGCLQSAKGLIHDPRSESQVNCTSQQKKKCKGTETSIFSMDRIRMPYGRNKTGIGMPLRGKRAKEEDKGHKHGQVTTSRRVEGPQSRIPEQQQPVFSLAAGVLTRTLRTAGRGGQAACSLTANDSSSRTHPADGPAPVYHSVDAWDTS